MLCRGGQAVPLSFDHKPNDPEERARIHKAGGFIRENGGHFRVNGNLNLSRCIGDLKYKQNKPLPMAEQMITAQVRRAPRRPRSWAKFAQKLGQLRPVILVAVFPRECMGQLASFGPA